MPQGSWKELCRSYAFNVCSTDADLSPDFEGEAELAVLGGWRSQGGGAMFVDLFA